MNRDKWENEYHPDPEFLAKLGEEFGEACERFGQMLAQGHANPTSHALYNGRRDQLIVELEHVEFIAATWRSKLVAFAEVERGA